MAKFVMANRRAGKFHETEKKAARNSMDASFGALASRVDVINDSQPTDDEARRVVVFEAEPAEMAAQARQFSEDVLLEPEILHWADTTVPLDLFDLQRAPAAAPALIGSGANMDVVVTGNNTPLQGAEVILFLRGFGGIRAKLEGQTDAQGQVSFSFASFFRPLGLIVVPAGDFWDVLVRGGGRTVTVDCQPLPADGPLQWWHTILGINNHDPNRGNGIRVGVVDSGVGPHPCLNHVTDIGAFINGSSDPNGGADSGSHGSHVNGIIGARPISPGQYAGLAPGVQLFSARVFPPNSGANQGDIVNAIDELSSVHQVDLINLSLGAPTRSEIERDAIQDALERGTLCVCAAANSGGPVEFPAAFSETVAISAVGLLGWGVPGSQATMVLPNESDKFGDEELYLADFSCFGPEIVATGPGVGIISTVPSRFGLAAPYSPMNGTSMASPAACAALAALLSADNNYTTLPRNKTRAERARAILRQNCDDIGLAFAFQGHGRPQVT